MMHCHPHLALAIAVSLGTEAISPMVFYEARVYHRPAIHVEVPMPFDPKPAIVLADAFTPAVSGSVVHLWGRCSARG
jgi:hypothetical protein